MEFLSLTQYLDSKHSERALTLKVLEAFPQDQLGFSIGEMRSAALIFDEIARIDLYYVLGMAGGQWAWPEDDIAPTKDGLKAALQLGHQQLVELLPTLSAEQLTTPVQCMWVNDHNIGRLMYGAFNESHHRGQLYAYLRALSITPPPFFS